MANELRRMLGNVRSFVGNATGGLRGGPNFAAWIVAGTMAYYLWIKPSQELKRQQEVIQFFFTLLFVCFSGFDICSPKG